MINNITYTINSLTSNGSILGNGSKYYGNGPNNTDNNLHILFDNIDLLYIPQIYALLKFINNVENIDSLLCIQTKLILYLNYYTELNNLQPINSKTFGIVYNNIYYVNTNIDYININNISY